jgi:MtN3 and saliva related transmembrane protein
MHRCSGVPDDAALIIGVVASIASIVSFVPQAVRILRTRDTQALSCGAYSVTVGAFALWTAYGIVLRDVPLIATNAICLCLAAFILVMRLLPDRRRRAVAAALGAEKA